MKQWTHGGNIYKYDRPLLDFSANINPLGMPIGVKQAIIDNIDNFERYPDPYCLELTQSIADFYRVNPDFIVCSNGAADLIFRLALLMKPKKALLVSPTFSEYEKALSFVDCNISHHFLLESNDFVLDDSVLDSIDCSFDILFICNPNNPTGISVNRDLMLKIAEKCALCDVFLVIDECFTEF